jgi:hypothetical protein
VDNNVRYYRIADITIQVKSDLPFKDNTFTDQIELFRVDGPGEDTVTIHHHFALPDLRSQALGKEVYHKAPWAIYQQSQGWLYLGILPEGFKEELWTVAVFNQDHSVGHIYRRNGEVFRSGNLGALTMFPTDQILIARLLTDRQGCYLHSAGAILNGAGMLFVGHSEAGKSTITQMLMDAEDAEETSPSPLELEILCDDRNIVRQQEPGWRIYGTWNHGDIPLVSPASAYLKAICFLEQANENLLIPLTDRQEINHRLLACLIKPFVTAGWWDKTIQLTALMTAELPFYVMQFDKSGEIVKALRGLNSKEK